MLYKYIKLKKMWVILNALYGCSGCYFKTLIKPIELESDLQEKGFPLLYPHGERCPYKVKHPELKVTTALRTG